MNQFFFNGYMRDDPVVIGVDGFAYLGFILTNDNGKLNIPIFVKTPQLIKKVKNNGRVGIYCEVQGEFETKTRLNENDYTANVQLFLVASEIKFEPKIAVRFKNSVVLEHILNSVSTDEIYNYWTKIAKTRKKKKKEDEDAN